MNGIAIGLGLLVAGAVVLFVAWPWRTQREAAEDESAAGVPLTSEALAERREGLLTALRDLDFDHAVGKVVEEDYAPLRETLLAEAAEAIAQLDGQQATTEAELDAYIEAAVLVRRQSLGAEHTGVGAARGSICPTCGRVAPNGDVYCGGCGNQLKAVCPACGRETNTADLFCGRCGTRLAVAMT
jgi:hypothetical protein